MGGGTKEKVARLAAESRLVNELAGIRSLMMLVFACVVFFTMYLAVNLSMSLESPAQQAALMSRLAKEKAERNERWKRRNAEQIAHAEPAKGEVQSLKRDTDDDIPPWATPRDTKAQKKYKKKLNDADEEPDAFGEEEAEMEVRTKMGEWMRESTQAKEKALMIAAEDTVITSLRKRQQFVEDGLDAIMARDPELDDFDLSILLETDIHSEAISKYHGTSSSTSSSSASKSTETEDLASESEEVAANAPALVGTVASNPAIKALRMSNLYTQATNKFDKAFGSHLTRMGYSPTPLSKTLPLWVVLYGQKCPETPDPTERHILICPMYLPSSPGAKHLPLHLAARSAEPVMREVLARSRHKRSDGKALSQALAELYGGEPMAPESFRLFRDKTKLEAHLARDAERKPVFVLQQNEGMTQPQLTNNVPSLLAGEKKYASKQIVLRRYNLNPALWEGKKFVVRSYAVIFHADPFLVGYMPGPVLRAPDAFVKPGATSVESSPASIHFPGTVPNSERFSWGKMFRALGVKDTAYVRQRIKQITAYALLSLGAPFQPKEADESRARQIGVQHVCFDFSLEDIGGSERVILEDIRTDCPIEKGQEERALIEATSVLAEEMLFRKTRQEPFGFTSLPSFSTVSSSTRLEVLFDEMKEQEKSRSLLDVMEDLASKRTSSNGGSGGLTGGKSGSLQCEDARPVLSEDDGQSFAIFAENFPICSSSDLDSLFSTAAVVGNGESVDLETFFNPKIERALQTSIRGLFQGNFRGALNEARLAGYAPCARASKKFVSVIFVPTSKGLSPIALKAFSCNNNANNNNNNGQKTTTPREGGEDVILEIPHPFFDHTRAEGLALFDSGVAKALIVSGTHRCAIAPPSGCTGSIGKAVRTNCGVGRTEYQNGDAAHSVETTFHVAHVALTEFLPSSIVVSLHSTKQDKFIVSDGTSHEVAPSAAVARVVSALARAFPVIDIASCNDFDNSPSKRSLTDSERDVCGATNVQGRHLNGAPDACRARVHENGMPLRSSGRFVHIEQPVALVKENEQVLFKGMEKTLRDALTGR